MGGRGQMLLMTSILFLALLDEVAVPVTVLCDRDLDSFLAECLRLRRTHGDTAAVPSTEEGGYYAQSEEDN